MPLHYAISDCRAILSILSSLKCRPLSTIRCTSRSCVPIGPMQARTIIWMNGTRKYITEQACLVRLLNVELKLWRHGVDEGLLPPDEEMQLAHLGRDRLHDELLLQK